MNSMLLTLGSYDIILSLVMGLITIIITLILVQVVVLKTDLQTHLLERNVAIGVFLGSVVFGVLANVNGSIEPAVNLLQTKIMGQGGLSLSVFLEHFFNFCCFTSLLF